MIQVREAVAGDATAIAALLGELGSAAPVALLSALVVQAGRRGQGVGRALIRMAEQQAAAWGCETLELTSRDDRHRTHRFYLGLGFESGSRKFARPVAGFEDAFRHGGTV